MNNIISFSEYREKVRLYEESLVTEQIMEPLEEGIVSKIRNKINRKATLFVQQALSDEIEMGKKLNEEIQKAVDELKEYIDKIQEYADEHGPKKSKLFKEVEKIFDDIHKASFELLEILSGVKINFADYLQNATMATFVNFGVLFIPVRATFLLKKSYKYFIGIIKNTIRRDMLMLMLNFDQFENTVLIQSLEDDEQNRFNDKYNTQLQTISEIERNLITSFKDKKGSINQKQLDNITKVTREMKKTLQIQQKTDLNVRGSLGFDSKYDNTYTKTLDQLKNFVLEDDNKYLEAIKNGMRTQSLDEVDTKAYVELLISAAEECAYEVSNAIHTNFIEKVSVFKLANQKTLIELVKKDKEHQDKVMEEERKKAEEELKKHEDEEFEKAIFDEKLGGPAIFKKVVSDHPGDSDSQVDAYKKLGEVEINGKKYEEKTLLNRWLSVPDEKSRDFENWNKNEDTITKQLKLYLDEVLPNKDGYSKYIEYISFIPRFAFKRTDLKTPKAGFTTYGKPKSYIDELKEIILEEKGDGYKEDGGKFVIDKNKEKILEKALELISENVKKIDKADRNFIIEIIEGIFTETTEVFPKVRRREIKTHGILCDIESVDRICSVIKSLNSENTEEHDVKKETATEKK